MCVCVCMCACVRACVRAFACVRLRACLCACVLSVVFLLLLLFSWLLFLLVLNYASAGSMSVKGNGHPCEWNAHLHFTGDPQSAPLGNTTTEVAP